MSPPRISFGMIVLNGEPFLRYNLRALYPFAHEIIVVEGAAPAAAAIATPDGHSRDETLATLRRFKAAEDPQDRLHIITRDGFWPEKDAMSQAYAARATGDYLWQVDVDEFYKAADMRAILELLRADPAITAVFFKQLAFWGGFDYLSDGWYLRQAQYQGPGIVPRLFKWGPGYRYAAHRPVVVVDDQGRDLGRLRPLNGVETARRGVFMYHYSLVFPQQVQEKSDYYAKAGWARRPRSVQWAEEVYGRLQRPYRVDKVYKYPSWLERFEGTHPAQIEALRADIAAGRVPLALRPTDDIERLLASRRYRLGRLLLKLLDPFARRAIVLWRQSKNWLPGPLRAHLEAIRTIGRW
jgi:hypothetical protein